MSNCSGFNLLEVVIGSFIFILVTIAMAGLWASHYRALGKPRHRVVANLMAQGALERAISDGFHGLPDFDSTTSDQVVTTQLNGNAVDVKYTVQTDIERYGNISPLPPARADKLKKVSIEVSWTEPGGKQALSLETVVASAD